MKTVTLLVFAFCLTVTQSARGQQSSLHVLPDTAFDAWVFHTPVAEAQAAELRFRSLLDSLLQQVRPDTVAIARTWRRIAAARLNYNGHGWDAHPFIQTSIRLLYQTKPLQEAELAKSLLVYANDLIAVGKYDSVLWALQTAIEINRRLYGEVSEGVGLDYRALAAAYGNTTRYEEGFTFAKMAVEILKKVYGKPHPYFARALFIRGWLQMELGYYEPSLKDYAEAEAIMRQTLGVEHPVTAGIYHFMGMSHQSLGDYDSALDCLNRAFSVREKTLGPDHPETRYVMTHMGDLYLEIGDYEQAISCRDKRINIHLAMEWHRKILADTSHTINPTMCQVALHVSAPYVRLYAVAGEFEKEAEAFEYLLAREQVWHDQNGYLASAYGYHALALAKQRRWQESLDWSEQAIALSQKVNPDAPQIANEFWQQKGEILTALARFDEAEAAFAEVLQHPRNPGDELKAWKGKAELFLEKARRGGQPGDLKTALKNYMIAIEKLDALRLSAWSPVSRMEQSRLNFSLFEGALATSALQNDLEAAFWLTEKSKAQSMLENLRDDIARRTAGLPDSLSRLESNLKNEIATLEQKAFETPPGSERQTAEASLFEKKQALGALAKSLETDHPEYFRLKYGTALASVADLQNRLLHNHTASEDSGQALLEYFTGDSTIFIFTLTKNHLELVSMPKPNDFEATIESLRNSLTDNELRMTGDDAALFAGAAAKLHGWLLAEPLKTLPPSVKNLIIVPDGLLSYVPFEVLGKTTEQPDFKTFPYLLRNFTVSYAASANLLLEQTERAKKGEEAAELFAGFAPSYADSDTLDLLASHTRALLVRDEKYALPGAVKEVEEIAALLGGKAFLATDATEHNFKENAPRFRILHLAMHSMLEDRNPMFSKLLFTKTLQRQATGSDSAFRIPHSAFEDGDLNASELYNLRLPAADLAVLSACNTGAGKLRRGEGVMSLSRAFTYAGVPATVMSLWQAPDEATRQVMVAFYKNLKGGMRKDEALRQAKLGYLSGCKEGAAASPFYWAGFVGAGKMDALFRD